MNKWVITYASPFFGWDSLRKKLEFKWVLTFVHIYKCEYHVYTYINTIHVVFADVKVNWVWDSSPGASPRGIYFIYFNKKNNNNSDDDI